jgi:hypothetical protein
MPSTPDSEAHFSVLHLTLLYINSETVISAPYQVRGRLGQARNDK